MLRSRPLQRNSSSCCNSIRFCSPWTPGMLPLLVPNNALHSYLQPGAGPGALGGLHQLRGQHRVPRPPAHRRNLGQSFTIFTIYCFFYRLATCWTTPTPGKPLPRYSRLGQSASYSKLKKKQFFPIVLLFDQTFLAEHVELYAARYHLSKISFLWSYQNNHLKKIICMSRHQDFSVKKNES